MPTTSTHSIVSKVVSAERDEYVASLWVLPEYHPVIF